MIGREEAEDVEEFVYLGTTRLKERVVAQKTSRND